MGQILRLSLVFEQLYTFKRHQYSVALFCCALLCSYKEMETAFLLSNFTQAKC